MIRKLYTQKSVRRKFQRRTLKGKYLKLQQKNSFLQSFVPTFKPTSADLSIYNLWILCWFKRLSVRWEGVNYRSYGILRNLNIRLNRRKYIPSEIQRSNKSIAMSLSKICHFSFEVITEELTFTPIAADHFLCLIFVVVNFSYNLKFKIIYQKDVHSFYLQQ